MQSKQDQISGSRVSLESKSEPIRELDLQKRRTRVVVMATFLAMFFFVIGMLFLSFLAATNRSISPETSRSLSLFCLAVVCLPILLSLLYKLTWSRIVQLIAVLIRFR
jgi:hypothetical protein